MKKLLIGAIAVLLIAMIVILAINIGQDENAAEDENDGEQDELDQFTQEEKNAITLATDWEDVFNWSREEMLENLLVPRTGWEISEVDADGVLDYLDFDYEEDAFESAKTYLLGSDYSDEELHKLLTDTDGFTEDEADYAIENLEESDQHLVAGYYNDLPITDEEKTAVRLAETWSRWFNLSEEELHEELLSREAITEESAELALQYARIDYNDNALERAEEYLDESDYSTEELHELLIETHGFTGDEADYAVENLEE